MEMPDGIFYVQTTWGYLIIWSFLVLFEPLSFKGGGGTGSVLN